MNKIPSKQDEQSTEFQQQAGRSQIGFFGEFAHFLLTNKKWWLTPIILVLLGLGVLAVLGSSGAAPFLYTLF